MTLKHGYISKVAFASAGLSKVAFAKIGNSNISFLCPTYNSAKIDAKRSTQEEAISAPKSSPEPIMHLYVILVICLHT